MSQIYFAGLIKLYENYRIKTRLCEQTNLNASGTLGTLATREGKQFSSRMRFCKIDRENTEHGAKHVAMALRRTVVSTDLEMYPRPPSLSANPIA